MVATRRSDVNAAPIPYVPPRPTKRRKTTGNDTTNHPITSTSTRHSISRISSMSTNSKAQIRPSSELSELPPTSPSTGRTPHHGVTRNIGQRKPASAKPSTEKVMAALKKLTTPGSSHNPIVLLDNSPPQVQKIPTAEPHMFLDRQNMPFSYAPRPALVPQPANGTTFTGQLSHDMYRMHLAKMTALSWDVSQQTRAELPLEMQYPIARRYLGSRVGTVNLSMTPKVQYFSPPPPTYPYRAAPIPPSEEQLRSKAMQYVREYSRLSPRKRKMAEDPDETSESDSTEIDVYAQRKPHVRPVAKGSMLSKSGPVTVLPDPHFQLMPLVEQASLLTSLLQVYPRSSDQTGLREDIAMLASIQNQHLADWLNFEVGQARKLATTHTPCVSRSIAMSPTKLPARSAIAGGLTDMEKKQKIQDSEIRDLLSADAKVWQDGSGLNVADVFADGVGLAAGGDVKPGRRTAAKTVSDEVMVDPPAEAGEPAPKMARVALVL